MLVVGTSLKYRLVVGTSLKDILIVGTSLSTVKSKEKSTSFLLNV